MHRGGEYRERRGAVASMDHWGCITSCCDGLWYGDASITDTLQSERLANCTCISLELDACIWIVGFEQL